MTGLTELGLYGNTQLWLVDLDAGSEVAGWEYLDATEQARALRFVFDVDRRRYVAAHSALRLLLARYTGRKAADVAYTVGEFGKPSLREAGSCRFNLSHSVDTCLIGISNSVDLGVDVEVLRPMTDASVLARDNFTPGEQVSLSASPEAERDLTFLYGWTRKEACLKATGSGLSIRPDSFEVGLVPHACQVNIPSTQGMSRVKVESFHHGARILGAWAEVV